MTRGKLQLTNQRNLPVEKRVYAINTAPPPSEETDEALLVNVLRRRWVLLVICLLLSVLAAILVAGQFTWPKAVTTAQLRYVELPPVLKEVYRAPTTTELAEILKSNESMAELAKRIGLAYDPRLLNKRFSIQASRFSNIIDIELRWRDGKQAIQMVNELTRIAQEKTASSRKQTLQQYGIETELQHETANQRVIVLREKVIELQQQRNSELSSSGQLGSEVSILMSQVERTEDALDQLTLRRVSLNRQLTTLRSDVATLREQIKGRLLAGRRSQIAAREKLYNRNSRRYADLQQVKRQLSSFAAENSEADYVAWRSRLEGIGAKQLGQIDSETLLTARAWERKLLSKEGKIEQVEFELLPIDGELSLLENRREAQERRLADLTGSADISSAALEEAEAQLEEAINSRSRLRNLLDNIRRGEETDFSEMTVLTAASWQTTEASDGRLKLFVFALGGCFVLLVLPVFALEHFFPSGDPADHASKTMGIPRVSRGAFVSRDSKERRRRLHPVNSEAIRLLALRIQQSVPGSGAIALFSGLNHEQSSIPMMSYLAECLARREEKVLIIDACDRPEHTRSANDATVNDVLATGAYRASSEQGAANEDHEDHTHDASEPTKPNGTTLPANLEESAGLVGLSDFLHRGDISADQMICPTSIPGVDIIPSGTARFPSESFASSALTKLLEQCREHYTLILMAGPSTNHPSDLQMLSARADAILFTVPSTGRPAGKGEDVVRDLLDMNAPIVGIVS